MKVLVVTPNVADSKLAIRFLGEQGIDAAPCAHVADLGEFAGADTGCILFVEEALGEDGFAGFQSALDEQPAWSDLPLLVVTSNESAASALFQERGNVSLLQRPIHPLNLVSAVRVALRSRRRQIQVRDLLQDRERALTKRDEFLAMLAHELRNPLAPIRNAVYLLSTLDYGDPLFLKCRNMIDKQARHITRLVDDLLDVSRLELGKMRLRLQRLDLNENAQAAVESCAALTSGFRHVVNVRLRAETLPVRADPVRLEQAICNLLVNAAKFTPEGGTIDVETRVEANRAIVSVSDNGMGINPETLETIFDLFAQEAVTLARSKGGLGIGLTLVKRLVERHGGPVHAYSEGLGTGSRFELRLPLDTSVEDAAAASRGRDEIEPKRVLVVEDGADTRDSLGMLMRAWNHEVFYAATGPEAVARARETHPDVALIDIGLPGFDGYQVARQIRRENNEWSRAVRLIALTGYGQEHDRSKALDAGFDVHVLKPVDPHELRSLLA